MYRNIYSIKFLWLAAAAFVFLFAGCSGAKKNHQPTIGLLLETLKEERWQHDRDYFIAAAEKMGAKVIVQSCNGSDETQIAQAENMITQGVRDALVVDAAQYKKIAATIV